MTSPSATPQSVPGFSIPGAAPLPTNGPPGHYQLELNMYWSGSTWRVEGVALEKCAGHTAIASQPEPSFFRRVLNHKPNAYEWVSISLTILVVTLWILSSRKNDREDRETFISLSRHDEDQE